MKLKILSVGRERADAAAPLVADYQSRLARFVPVEDVVLRPEREDRTAQRMLKEAGPGRLLVALDEKGKSYDSYAFARFVGGLLESGKSEVVFILGGADGLPSEVKSRADYLLSLSAMTLPHRLARLLLFEQLYRALCILKGVPYQK
ncbi:MAG: 23S rRNA (pseudouridine(1915)-N(3))-methyltransferase RlmH [Myxococcota bacterium]|nr:23S rRNA (pseudouridine(1915)-N(3))-methyltransferase RlmH [Myxococcota bacterium]